MIDVERPHFVRKSSRSMFIPLWLIAPVGRGMGGIVEPSRETASGAGNKFRTTSRPGSDGLGPTVLNDVPDQALQNRNPARPGTVGGVTGPRRWSTLGEMCRDRAAARPGQRAFSFLPDGEAVSDTLTLAELDEKATAIAARLSKLVEPGARAILAYPPGLDFITAFVGCLYANVVAVPVPAPASDRGGANERLTSIIRSAGPKAFLSTSDVLASVDAQALWPRARPAMSVIATDALGRMAADLWSPPYIGRDDVAYMQYSSGSTGMPKGVMLTHGNALADLDVIERWGGLFPPEGPLPLVSWLPFFHDMGLVCSVLQPLFTGFEATLMPPMAFVRRPVRWLAAVSKLGQCWTVAPNFAYELSVRRTTPEQRQGLDLSRVTAAVSSEPVRAGTLERFAEAFAGCGFRPSNFFPCYGLAESTLMVTGGPAYRELIVRHVDERELAAGRVRMVAANDGGRALVGCGRIDESTTIVAVEPGTSTPCAADRVGELWIASPSIGTGYWNAPEETARTFGGSLAEHPGKSFLRSGDLGFIHDGEVFVVGRLKDVIILDGQNHHPSDIEATVTDGEAAVLPARCCAFSYDDGQAERLVVLAEVPKSAATAETTTAIRQGIATAHGLRVHDVLLLARGSLPLTSSGKIRRIDCRQRYLDGGFNAYQVAQ